MPEETIETKLDRIERLAGLGLKPAAAQLSRLILEKDPRNVQALIWLARTSPLPDEAQKATRQAEVLAPNDHQVQELLASKNEAPIAAGVGANPYYTATAAPNPAAPNPFNDYNPATGQWNQPNPPSDISQSTFDYLQMLNATNPGLNNPMPQSGMPSTGMASPVLKPLNPPRKTSPGGVVFGLLFLLVGLGLGIFWALQLLNFNNDLSQASKTLSGQITQINSTKMDVDLKGDGKRTFDINGQIFNSLAPLISPDSKSLAPNSVVLNLTPTDRLVWVEVLTPKAGNTKTGLLGFGSIVDWAIVGLCVILAIVGLVLLSRAMARSKK